MNDWMSFNAFKEENDFFYESYWSVKMCFTAEPG